MSIVINKETKTTGERQFTPKPTLFNGLSLGKLVEVTVSELDTIDASSKWISFRGHKPPRLSFKFVEVTKDEPGVYRHTFIPIDFKGEKVKEKHDAFTSTIGHFLEVIRGNKNVELITKDEKGVLVDLDNLEGQALIDTWTRFFKDIAASFINKDGKLYGEDGMYWMKLLLYIKGKPVNNNNPGLAMYPGEGVLERFVEGKPAQLSIKIEKGESIIPIAPNTNTIPQGIPGDNIPNGATAPRPDWFPKQ
jgi:hypothetical protein